MNPCRPTYKNCLLFCLLIFALLSGCGNSEEVANATFEKPEKIVPVVTEIVALTDMTETFTLPASLEAWEDLILSAEIAGPIRKFNYQEGQRAKAGSVLLQIDSETLESSLARDEENFAVTKRKLIRFRSLSAEGLVSDQEIDELENSLTAADTALRATRVQLAKCFPKAPISGIVDLHYVDRGEYVDPGKPLLRLVQVDKLKAIADVPEKDIGFLQVGQTVEIIPAVINNQVADMISGKIVHIAFSADESTRTYRTKIAIDNNIGQLRPGMIVRAKFVRQELQQVVAAPLYSVLDRDGKKLVFVEEDGQAKSIEVVTGSSVEQKIEIKSGLSAGQKLIVKGQQLLMDGVKIASGEK